MSRNRSGPVPRTARRTAGQSRGLLGERLAALQHDRALPAPRQLVGGRQCAHPRADDDDHARNRSSSERNAPPGPPSAPGARRRGSARAARAARPRTSPRESPAGRIRRPPPAPGSRTPGHPRRAGQPPPRPRPGAARTPAAASRSPASAAAAAPMPRPPPPPPRPGRRAAAPVASDGVVQTTVTVELSPRASQVHCPGESGPAGRDRDPLGPTRRPRNRQHPNRTRLRQIPSPAGGDRLHEHRNR